TKIMACKFDSRRETKYSFVYILSNTQIKKNLLLFSLLLLKLIKRWLIQSLKPNVKPFCIFGSMISVRLKKYAKGQKFPFVLLSVTSKSLEKQVPLNVNTVVADHLRLHKPLHVPWVNIFVIILPQQLANFLY